MQPERFSPDQPAARLSAQRRTTLVVFLVLLVGSIALTSWMVLPYLLAVIMGSILALLSQPVFQWLKRHRVTPRLASLIVTLGIIMLVIAPISTFATKAVQQGIAIGGSLAEGGFSFRSLVEELSGWGPIEAVIGSPQAFENQVRGWIRGAGSKATAMILSVAGNVPNLVLQLALASLACFFFLVDGNRLQIWMRDKVPLDADVRVKIVESFRSTAVSVIWATLAAASAQSIVIWLSYIILGVPAAFLAAGATFIFAWIPIIGSTPVWVAGAVYLYVQGATWKVIAMVVFGLIAGVVDNFVRPLVLKGRSKMHPLVSLVAIFGGISMFGILGVFFGPILAAIMISLLQIWPSVGSRFGVLPQGALAPRSDRSRSPNTGEKASA